MPCYQGSLAAPITSPDPSSANKDCQQSPAGAAAGAADQPGNEPQNPVLDSGTAAGSVTDVSHTSSTDNEDPADYAARGTGEADYNSQRTEAASLLNCINGGFLEHKNGLNRTNNWYFLLHYFSFGMLPLVTILRLFINKPIESYY